MHKCFAKESVFVNIYVVGRVQTYHKNFTKIYTKPQKFNPAIFFFCLTYNRTSPDTKTLSMKLFQHNLCSYENCTPRKFGTIQYKPAAEFFPAFNSAICML